MTFLFILFGVGIVLAVIQGLLGIAPSAEPEQEENNVFSSFVEEDEEETRYKSEIDDEMLGVANHGHGMYKAH